MNDNGYIRSSLDQLLDEDKKDFSQWAFGEDYSSVEFKDIPFLWNMRHGKEFFINSDDLCKLSVKGMVDLFYKRRKS